MFVLFLFTELCRTLKDRKLANYAIINFIEDYFYFMKKRFSKYFEIYKQRFKGNQ